MADFDVTFTDDIPKIEREGFTRESKYTPLLDACVERVGKAAVLSVETQGQASSRASSIKDAASKHPKVTSGEGHFEVATRSAEDEHRVYVKYMEGPAEEEESGDDEAPKKTTKKRRTKKAAKAS